MIRLPAGRVRALPVAVGREGSARGGAHRVRPGTCTGGVHRQGAAGALKGRGAVTYAAPPRGRDRPAMTRPSGRHRSKRAVGPFLSGRFCRAGTTGRWPAERAHAAQPHIGTAPAPLIGGRRPRRGRHGRAPAPVARGTRHAARGDRGPPGGPPAAPPGDRRRSSAPQVSLCRLGGNRRARRTGYPPGRSTGLPDGPVVPDATSCWTSRTRRRLRHHVRIPGDHPCLLDAPHSDRA